MASLITHRLGATFPGFQDQSFSRGLFWGTTGFALLAPVIASWIYLSFFYRDVGADCDRVFWDHIMGNHFSFPFVFSVATAQHSIFFWTLFGLGLLAAIYSSIKGFYLLRLEDMPWVVIGSFILLALASFACFFSSLDLYGREKINLSLNDKIKREALLNQNVEILQNTLSDQANISLTPANMSSILEYAVFSDGKLYRQISEGPKALFMHDSRQALFEGCKQNINLQISFKTPKGTTVSKDVTVSNIAMPVAFQTVTETEWWREPLKRFRYYGSIFNVLYLFGWMWWVYLIITTLPLWGFFAYFALYKMRLIRIQGRM
ncbi:MAG: hypothetical protein HQK60_09300 [Deltaproteobacteria bacterium]|nr:hypothetical protein [Deltaproteobacteria bacterium]